MSNPALDLATLAKSLGWSLAGVCSPVIPEEAQKNFTAWIESFKGPQMNYLQKRLRERLSPAEYFPEVRSVLVFGFYYFPGWAKGDAKVSNYAWGEDYHELLKQKLERTAETLKTTVGNFSYRVCVDTAPLLEKVLAVQAGLGWQGKNTLILNRKFGSCFFLGELLTSIPISTFEAPSLSTNHCGNCQRCIEACPTNALTPNTLDASKCISYWTLEHKGAFDLSTPKYSDWIAGCDICQEVCPWNQKLTPIPLNSPLKEVSANQIELTEWQAQVDKTALSYVPKENWARNLRHILEKLVGDLPKG